MNDRARIHVGDVIMAAVVAVAAVAMAPVFYDLTGMISPDAGPLGQMLLMLIVPFIFVGIVLSAGVSARRRQ